LGSSKRSILCIRRSRGGLDRELPSQLSNAVRDESRRPFARRPHGVCRSPLVGGAPQGLSAPYGDRPVGSARWDARFRRRRARQERRVGDGSARGASWGRSGCAIHAQPGPRRTAGSFDPAGEFLVVAGDWRRRDGSALADAGQGQSRERIAGGGGETGQLWVRARESGSASQLSKP
jgi:hypothetical protein